MTLHLSVVAFAADPPHAVHVIVVKGYGRNAQQSATTCCGAIVGDAPDHRLVARDGEPATCQACLEAISRPGLRFHEARADA